MLCPFWPAATTASSGGSPAACPHYFGRPKIGGRPRRTDPV